MKFKPHNRANFVVSFEPSFESEEVKAALEVIASHLTSIDLGSEVLGSAELHHRTQRAIMWLTVDDSGLLMKAIRKLSANSAVSFTTFVAIYNENKDPVELYALSGCMVEALQHSILSREPADEVLKLRGESVRGERYDVTGSISNGANRANSMKLLQITFQQMTQKNFN